MTVLSATPITLPGKMRLALPGDVIELVGGSYPFLSMYASAYSKTGVVTVRPAAGASVVMEGLAAQLCDNWLFDRIHFKPRVTVANDGACVTLAHVKNFSFTRCILAGDAIPVEGLRSRTTYAGKVDYSENVSFVACDISMVGYGISFRWCNGLTFRLNDTFQIRCDAYRGQSSNILAMRNIVSDMYPYLDPVPEKCEHPDAFQLWTSDTGLGFEMRNIQVLDNWFVRGEGSPTQGIFQNNEMSRTVNNIEIAGNMIGTGMWNGIKTTKATGVRVHYNYVFGEKGLVASATQKDGTIASQPMKSWVNTDSCPDAISANNVVAQLDPGALAIATEFRRTERHRMIEAEFGV